MPSLCYTGKRRVSLIANSISYHIHGHTVHVDEGAEGGYKHLAYELSASEAEVFFHEAKTRGEAHFEDRHDHNFTLTHSRAEATYTISRR